MESCSQLYIRKIIDSILNNIKQRHNNILFVKYYNTLNLRESELREVFETQDDDICFLYHEFSSKYMHSVFEPFLDWIMELYQKFYSDVAIDEFLEKADVYFSVDGKQEFKVENDDKLIISRSLKQLRLIDIKGHSFFDAVNNKLMNPIK